METLPVNELFDSFQGEGAHMGRAAFFVRLQGCPLRCDFCDTKAAWNEGGTPMTALQIAERARESAARIAVVTGGEPAMRDLTALVRALKGAGKRVHLETSGAFPIRGEFDFIAVSPKRRRPPLAENLARANEVKVVVETADDIAYALAFLPQIADGAPLWLQPEASRAGDRALLCAIAEAVRAHGEPLRAGVQLHKYYAAR